MIRIGTRDSQLAVWQAQHVMELLANHGVAAELVYVKSEGDVDITTPLYEMGIQGIFTRTLDTALLNGQIDLAVHSMKDVPTKLATGIVHAAVLKRGPYKDVFVYNRRERIDQWNLSSSDSSLQMQTHGVIATSSIRRKAQWLRRYPQHTIDSLRGNVPTRLRKVYDSNWDGAIFAQAGLERINLRPAETIELDWMLPAPAQGAILVVCRLNDDTVLDACAPLSDVETALCTKIERDFLRALLGGCSTPISALALIHDGQIMFRGNILSPDGSQCAEIEIHALENQAESLGLKAAEQLINEGGKQIIEALINAKKSGTDFIYEEVE